MSMYQRIKRHNSFLTILIVITLLVLFTKFHRDSCIPNNRSAENVSKISPIRDSNPALNVWNRNRLEYDSGLRKEFERLIQKEAESDDRDLVGLVRRMLDPPSKHVMRKPTRAIFQTPQAEAVDELFKGQTGLFFVEAGALDGERSSNTLWLEATRGWTGLLVEADAFMYTQLRGKARTAYSINACLSSKLQQLEFQACTEGSYGCGTMKKNKTSSDLAQSRQISPNLVPCFSLETMMLALNRSTIDYFSLDVEGHEYEVLDAVPWKILHIRVLTIEYVGVAGVEGPEKEAHIAELKAYMKKRGYRDVRQFDEKIKERDLWNRDIMFVKDKGGRKGQGIKKGMGR